MLVNKDQNQDHAVRVSFEDSASKQERALSGPVDEIVFGTAQYQWHADTAVELVRGKGHASPDGPPLKSTIEGAGPDTLYRLPKASIIVLRGRLAGE
jgi:hypothetical protein